MFNFLSSKSFEQKALGHVESAFRKKPGGESGKILFGVFESLFERAQSEAGLPFDFVEQLEASGMSDRAAGISLLDAAITGGKNLLRAGLAPESLSSTIFVMEMTLDKMFLDHPNEVVPRNGSVGPEMSQFTKDWN